MRSIDWSKTAVGAVESWPASLRTTVSTLLHSRHPMFLWWGPELVQFYNDAYLPSFGVGKHPLAMSQPGKECWPEIWHIIGPQISDVMSRGISSWHENQLVPIFRNGRLEDVYWTYGYSPVFGDRGEILGTLVVCTETTAEVVARTERDQALREAEAVRQRLIALIQNAPAFVCILRGPEHLFELANPLYQRLVGPGRELLGKTVREALPELALQGFIERLDRVYASGEPFVGEETLVRLDRRGDGVLSDAFVTFVYQPRLDAEGRAAGIDVFGYDVSDQVVARREVQATGEARRALAEAIPQQLWTATPEGQLDFVNERVLEYFAAGREAIIGAGWEAGVHPDDLRRCLSAWHHSLATGERYETEFRLRKSDGEYRWHLGRALAMRNPEGRVVRWFGTNTDIHEAKTVREELQERNDFEQYLIGIVSHDLRNPLTAIQLGVNALSKRENVDGPVAKTLLRMQSSVSRAVRLIRDLLDFTQSRLGGGIPITLRRASIHELASEVVEELRITHPDRELLSARQGDGWGAWDPDRIVQILGNLLSNAIRYGSHGSPVRLVTRGSGDEVIIEVSNQGDAIDPELLPTLFRPLKRGNRDGDRLDRSVGLGLYIVRELVRIHGGTVSVSSTTEEGTTFTVCLPRSSAEGRPPRPP